MLISAGLKLPEKIFVHDYVVVEGQKMSKSLGNVVDPIGLIDRYSRDALRYFLVAENPTWKDTNFSEKSLVARINGELMADLSNLVARVLTIAGKVDPSGIDGKDELSSHLNLKKIKEDIDTFDLYGAVNELWAFIRRVNKYVNDKKPWELKGEELNNALYNALESIRVIAILLQPFMPDTADKIFSQLGIEPQGLDSVNFDRFTGTPKRGENLFGKVDAKA